MLGEVQTVFTIFHILSFLSLWLSTILLLHPYSQKLGKVKFWSTIGIPIVFYVSIFLIVTPFVQSFSDTTDSSLRIVVDVFGYILPAISSGILFGLPFWMIARTLNYGNILRYYLIIASSGVILFELASTSNVIPASYPPFGLVSISFVDTSSYLILMGIYSSTISIAKDHKLRQSIRKNPKELKLLDSIGTSQMEQEIQKRVSAATRATQEGITREAGIQSFLNEDDMKQYLQQVIEDVKESENKSNMT
jgi:hypothetical protein